MNKLHNIYNDDGEVIDQVEEPHPPQKHELIREFLKEEETKQVLKAMIHDRDEEKKLIVRQIDDTIRNGLDADYRDRWGYELLNETLHKKLAELEKDIFRLKGYVYRDTKHAEGRLKVEEAKSVSIDTLLGQPKLRAGNRNWYNCIFHNEDTPSLCVYTKDNSFYCFGCNKWGSAIDIYMHQNGVEFVKAVKEMTSGLSTTIN